MLRYIATLAVVTVVLAGCSDDDPGAGPDNPVTASASPTPSDTPSDTPSAEESESFDPAKETARQFIQRWMALDAEMQVTGDATDYRKLYDDTCGACERLVADIESIHEAGGYVKVEPSRIVNLERDTKNQWTVRFRSKGTELRRGEDKPVEHLESGEYVQVVYLARDRTGEWRLLDYANG